MIKHIIFDMDGVVVRKKTLFSQRFSQDFGVPLKEILHFFEHEFQLCLIGQADLKQELGKYLTAWNWQGTVDELLAYWLENEGVVDDNLLDHIRQLRTKPLRCYLATNNEKYRAHYLFETVGLKKSFDAAFASAHLRCKKPEQEFWSALHEHMGKPSRQEVLVWDDSLENVASAKEFGFQAEFYSDFPAYKKIMRTYLC